jgi:outer membrane receptor protein involved in Fe transport
VFEGVRINENHLSQEGSSENYYNGYRGNISAFYDLNAYNSINSSFSFGGRTMPFNDEMEIDYESHIDSNSYSSINITNKTDNTLNMEWTTDYTKTFANNEDRKFSFAFQVGGDLNDGDTKIDESGTLTFNQNDEKTMEETFQVDYTHPFGKNKLEIGAKIINRDREMVYSDSSEVGYFNADIFNYNQLVPSSYISTEINLPFGLGLKTGLRYEQTNVSGNWKTDKTPRFDTTYYNLLPNLVLSKSFSPMRSIKFSYNNRITRPGVRNINPNTNSTDSRNITEGNPNLKPTLTEQFEIGVNSFGKITQGSYQVYYKHSIDVIEKFLEIEDDISTSTYKNIGETIQYGASYFGSIRLSKFTFRGSVNLYQYTGKDASLGFNKWTDPVLLYSYSMGGNVKLGNNWKAETFGFFRSPTQTIQGSSTTFSMMSFGIKKIFKNKRGSLGLRVIEPFKKDKVFTTDLAGENFSQVSTRSIPFRSFGISFKYTFGKLNFKSSNKKTSIKNDDIKEESSGEF